MSGGILGRFKDGIDHLGKPLRMSRITGGSERYTTNLFHRDPFGFLAMFARLADKERLGRQLQIIHAARGAASRRCGAGSP